MNNVFLSISVTKLLDILVNFHSLISKRVQAYPKIDEVQSIISIYLSNITEADTEEENKQECLKKLLDSKKDIHCFSKPNSNLQSMINEIEFFNLFNNLLKNFQSKVYSKLNLLSDIMDVIDIKVVKFNSLYEFIDFINNYFDYKNLEGRGILFFFKEFWVLLRNYREVLNNLEFNNNLISVELFDRMILFFSNYYIYNSYEEDKYLHKAILSNNIKEVYKLCNDKNRLVLHCDINEIDIKGNTPLLLALKNKNYDICEVLCDHNANIKKKTSNELSPLEFAISIKDRVGLKILLVGIKKQRYFNWNENLLKIHKHLKLMPNFKLSLKLTFDSNILSIFKSFTPNDSFTIYKKEGSLKIDLNISKAYFKGIKGCFSILIQERGNKLNVFKIDYENKLCVDFFNFLLSNSSQVDIESEINSIIKDGLLSKKTTLRNLTLEELVLKDYSLNNKINQKTKPFISKGELIISHNRLKPLSDKEIQLCINNDDIDQLKFNSCKEFKVYNFSKNRLSTDYFYEYEKDKDRNHKENSNTKEYVEYSNSLIVKYLEKKSVSKTDKKIVSINLFFSDEFPMKLTHILPLIHVLSMISNEFDIVKRILTLDTLPFNQLPVKISFPIGMSFYGLFEVVNYSDEDPSDSIFEVNFENQIDNEDDKIEDSTKKQYSIRKNLVINIDEINKSTSQDLIQQEKMDISKQIKNKAIFFNSSIINDSLKISLLKEVIQDNQKVNLNQLNFLPFNKLINKTSKAYIDFQSNYFTNKPISSFQHNLSHNLPSEKVDKKFNKSSLLKFYY